MKNILIAALDEKSGKSVIAYAIAALSGKRFGYMKPMGNNVIYREKKVMDQDAILFSSLMGNEISPERMCIGMSHSKITHFYEDALEEFMKRYEEISKDKELFIVEGGEFIWKGASLKLDAFSISKAIDAEIIFVILGDYYEMLDEIEYLGKIKNMLPVKGFILNGVDEEDAMKIKNAASRYSLKYLGFLPTIKKLRTMKVSYVVDKLFGRVVAGENGLNKEIENIFIAALSASEIKRHPDFGKEKKLIITGGDRSDVIAACLDERTSAIILTNNIVPSAKILAMANDMQIPLISVRTDTYTVARMVEGIKPVIMPDEKEKLMEIEREARGRILMDEILTK